MSNWPLLEGETKQGRRDRLAKNRTPPTPEQVKVRAQGVATNIARTIKVIDENARYINEAHERWKHDPDYQAYLLGLLGERDLKKWFDNE